MTATWSAIVLSQGDRPQQLSEAVGSLLAQRAVEVEVVVVGNGWKPTGLPDAVATLHLPTNLGAPEGRNRGLELAHGELLFFLDDDARLAADDVLATLTERFAADPHLGIAQTRIESPEGRTARRWVPRLRDKDPLRGSAVFSFLEGSVAIRRTVLEAAGGWAGEFVYAHEGIDLAWRAWDAGFTVEYQPDLVAVHPLVTRDRHGSAWWQDGRNRVWLARRNLPCVIAPLYVATWGLLVTASNVRGPSAVCAWLRGAVAGLKTSPSERRAMRWSTVAAMTRRGRPPVV